MPAVFFDLDPTTRPVVMSARPDNTHPFDFDPATVRIVRSDEVRRGDVVLGEVYDFDPGHSATVSYLPYGCLPYDARPRPLDPRCPCMLCHDVVWDPYTYLTDPIVLTVWQRDGLAPVCQINNGDELVLVIPARWSGRPKARDMQARYCRVGVERAVNAAFDRLRSYYDLSHRHDRQMVTGAMLAFLDDPDSPFPHRSHHADES
ncbi:hypothetical protein ACIQCR_16825 [Streptomyces sp. NPDC093249]|uniref:hypothetical protein n=1 Tax=unclassified Streptomyces TaxID=2593676 RepID=UPI00344B5E8A